MIEGESTEAHLENILPYYKDRMQGEDELCKEIMQYGG